MMTFSPNQKAIRGRKEEFKLPPDVHEYMHDKGEKRKRKRKKKGKKTKKEE